MKENNVKSTSKNKTKLIIIAALLISLIVLIPIGYALFSDYDNEKTNTKMGTIEVILEEDWPDRDDTYDYETPDGTIEHETYDDFGIKKYSKNIWGHSVGDLPAYVRIRCIPVVQYFEEDTENPGQGEWITAPVDQDCIEVSFDSIDTTTGEATWVKQGDYWYYKNVLPVGEDTAPMSIDWQIIQLPVDLSGKRVRTDVRVVLEYAQTTHDMWKELFQINDLPTGVERVQE